MIAMPARTTPPFRADHVGSFLRPKYLLDAREQKAGGEITPAELRVVEDRAIGEVVRMQEAARQRGDDPHELPHRSRRSSTASWRSSRKA
jgi:hypothetical protein